ncbi:hypothetical protein P7K49_013501, partial [Saguinus oedipus]
SVGQVLLRDQRGPLEGTSGGRSSQSLPAREERVSVGATAAAPACAPLSWRAP